MTAYNKAFFDDQMYYSGRSANIVVPLLVDFLHPRSVVDVGCGVGEWLAAFAQNGVEDILGMDGPWVDQGMLKIPREKFLVHDLTKAIHVNRTFDLVISLEVAEHLDEKYAATFIKSLVELGPVIAFTGAVPYQGGANHVNEQWPDYWVDLFDKHGYAPADCIRKCIWKNSEVAWWYSQNLLLFVQRSFAPAHDRLMAALESTNIDQLSLVHPINYLRHASPDAVFNIGPRRVLRALPTMIARSFWSRVKFW